MCPFLKSLRFAHLHSGAVIFIRKEFFYMYNTITPEKRTYTVLEVAEILNIGKNKAYTLIKDANFKVVRIGNSIRISKKSFDDWLDETENL